MSIEGLAATGYAMSPPVEERALSSQHDRLARHMVVWSLSTPDETLGSLNDPREQEENGIRFNEKWVYHDLSDDPVGARMRIVYWLRYDFVGTVIRSSDDEPWQSDNALAPVLSLEELRLYCTDRRSPQELESVLALGSHRVYEVGRRNPPVISTAGYRPVSEFQGPADLGGHLQIAATEKRDKELR